LSSGGITMGIEFFQTRMGSKFFEADLPRLIKAIERVADALAEKQPEKRKVWVIVYEDYHDTAVYLDEDEAKNDYRDTLKEQFKNLPPRLREKGEALLREDKLNEVQQLLADCAAFARVRLLEKVLK
jgi:hypothetical protein